MPPAAMAPHPPPGGGGRPRRASMSNIMDGADVNRVRLQRHMDGLVEHPRHRQIAPLGQPQVVNTARERRSSVCVMQSVNNPPAEDVEDCMVLPDPVPLTDRSHLKAADPTSVAFQQARIQIQARNHNALEEAFNFFYPSNVNVADMQAAPPTLPPSSLECHFIIAGRFARATRCCTWRARMGTRRP